LSALGIPLMRETTVGDDTAAILAEFKRAWKSSDVVIVTGGLGPTHDDISKAAVAKFFRTKMTLHKPTLKAVRERFARLGYATMPEINIGQAMVPEGFRTLKNDRGTAPGLMRHEHGKTFVILPGVPLEMEAVVQSGVIPFLRRTYKRKLEAIRHRTLVTTGIGESSLAEKLGDPKEFLREGTTLAFLPRAMGVRLRITTHAKTAGAATREIARVENILRKRADKYFLGSEDETLESLIVKLLAERSKTISTAESCTGGLIASMITNVPGASAVYKGSVIAYNNSVKITQLGVKPETLERFGAVSEEASREMAQGVLELLGTDFALSVTGIAGPGGGTPEKPVGTIWVALAERGAKTIAQKLQLDFGRNANRERASQAALEMLRKRLNYDLCD
ncbi:MAG TPA: competence/damage-inducible protein A, partial [Candidatus Kapabacteria bacterium]|nr:competence/damage-inducible protein A [Candidatus Kapabacteria bacterium]